MFTRNNNVNSYVSHCTINYLFILSPEKYAVRKTHEKTNDIGDMIALYVREKSKHFISPETGFRNPRRAKSRN